MFNNAYGGGYSLSDIAAVSGRNNDGYGNNGFMGDGAWWVVILFLFVFCGWGNNGWGGNGNGAGLQGALTRADLCQDLNFGQMENGIRGIQQGLCDGFYAQNTNLLNGFAGVHQALTNGFAGVDNAICTLGYQTQAGINSVNVAGMQNTFGLQQAINNGVNGIQTQLADCCCKNSTGQMQIGNQIERGFCDVNYAQATNTNAIIQNAHNDSDRIIAKLDAMEMARKDETIADLRTKLAACGDQTTAQYIVNQLTGVISPRPVPAYPAASPCGLGNWAPQVLASGCCNQNNCCNQCCGC